MRHAVSRFLLLLVALTASCAAPTFPVTPRAAGDRTPLTGACTPFDDDRCLVPWPSNTFTVADSATATGLRLSVDVSAINPNDVGDARLAQADGFSRVSSLAVMFEGTLDESSFGGPRHGAIRLFVATPSSPHFGEEVPLRIETYADRASARDARCALIADPLAVLEPETDYVAVVTDSLHAATGPTPSADAMTRVALGLAPPASADEALLAGYYAPILSLLDHVDIDPSHVVRAWDFTTRSIVNSTAPLDSMVAAALAAVEGGSVTVVFDVVEHQAAGGPIASIIEGRLVGLPVWLDANSALVTDANGIPTQQGTGDAPFRIVIPSGTGDYRAALYGHGAGGNFHDSAFDETLAAHGVAKVGVQFYGWGDDLVVTLARLVNMLDGAHRAFAPLMQATAHASAIGEALGGLLDDALSAPMLDGMTNPNAGRHIDWSQPTWIGGSLGGTMGLVVSAISPDIHIAVLNVPGAAWSHWVFQSAIFQTFLSGISSHNGGSTANVVMMIAIAQNVFDPADGASFGERARADHDVYLEQESIGDEVLPNPGNEFVAILTGATQVGVPLHPIEGLSVADHATNATGMTQYQVGDTGIYAVHGFAARDTAAGNAAFAQIQSFLDTAWAGSSQITVPTGCPATGCVFPATP